MILFVGVEERLSSDCTSSCLPVSLPQGTRPICLMTNLVRRTSRQRVQTRRSCTAIDTRSILARPPDALQNLQAATASSDDKDAEGELVIILGVLLDMHLGTGFR
ncbi:hypothetical protein PGT21_018506 [Puccinia graminis f. sp. tritici]|uniref:Uncharacterized protein n=1 Tax=Puccinia graminis f. sp. tritici TaxID=56615 RepID=A0A5B0MHX6_PUCGR|nr:hypothetical protein PGT21_018506 [Puccinia graminis f. sp. tritici]